MSTKVGFNRDIIDARPNEIAALRDIKEMVFPFATVGAIRSGKLSAHYLEASTKGDASKLAVFFNTGDFVDIAYVALEGIFAYGGFIATHNLESIKITDRITNGFFDLEAVVDGETLMLAYDPAQSAYALVESSSLSDAALAAAGARKAA